MGEEQFGRGNLQARLAEAGIWKDVAFNPANFASSGAMTVTIDPTKINVNRYCRIGNILHWYLQFFGGVLGGTATNQINLIPPYGTSKIAKFTGGQFAQFTDGTETMASLNASPNYAVTVVPFPVRLFVLTSSFQLKMMITYELKP